MSESGGGQACLREGFFFFLFSFFFFLSFPRCSLLTAINRKRTHLDAISAKAYMMPTEAQEANACCPLSETHAQSVGFRASEGSDLTYIAYLDEFGHIGPYVERNDPKFKESPVFGLAGSVAKIPMMLKLNSGSF